MLSKWRIEFDGYSSYYVLEKKFLFWHYHKGSLGYDCYGNYSFSSIDEAVQHINHCIKNRKEMREIKLIKQ